VFLFLAWNSDPQRKETDVFECFGQLFGEFRAAKQGAEGICGFRGLLGKEGTADMEFTDLVPVADEILKDWMLHKSEARVFDFKKATPIMVSVNVTVHDEVMRSPFYGLLSSFERPVFLLSMMYSKQVRIGMGWTFDDVGPLLEYSNWKGVSHDRRDVLTYQRFCMFESNGVANLLCTPIGGETQGIPFIHILEKDGATNYSEVGILDNDTGSKIFSIRETSVRPCVFCSARDEPCACSHEMTLRSFGPNIPRKGGSIASGFGFNDEPYVHTAKKWLSGRWGFHANGLPAFSTNAVVLSGGNLFDKARNYICQQEAQQICGPRQFPILEFGVNSGAAHAVLGRGEGVKFEFLSDSVSDQMSSSSSKAPEPRWKCRICDATFSRVYDVKRHEEGVHSSSRGFACPQCSQTFKQMGHLNEHLRAKHSESGAHICSLCGKRFGVESKLTRHVLLVHMDIRKFECRYCNKTYKEKHIMMRHMKKKHGAQQAVTRN